MRGQRKVMRSGTPLDSGAIHIIEDRSQALAEIDAITAIDLFSGYQHPAFLKAWVSQRDVEPFFIRIETQYGGHVLLPLERQGTHNVGYVGGKHANGNFPIGSPEGLRELNGIGLDALAESTKVQKANIGTIALERQLESLEGVKNPFVDHRAVRSPNVALSFDIEGDFDEVLQGRPGSRKRKRFRSQMRKLEAMGPVSVEIPVGAKTVREVLARFFELKSQRLKDAGIHNSFGDVATRAAFYSMFADSADRVYKTHQLFVLKVGDKYAAIMGNTLHNKRLTVEFSTFDAEFAHAGPGDLLFFLAVEYAVQNGCKVFDFGVGDERFKRTWCDIETYQYDVFIPVSLSGRLYTAANKMRSQVVGQLKSNEKIWNAAKAARRRLAGT